MLEPLQECRVKDAAAPVKGIAGQPDQFRFVIAELTCGFKLFAQLAYVDDVTERNLVRPVDQRECGARVRKMLPDELEHKELVEIGVEQRTGDGIEFPVMVMRASGQVDDHDGPNCIEWLEKAPKEGSGWVDISETPNLAQSRFMGRFCKLLRISGLGAEKLQSHSFCEALVSRCKH
jgi:hypothetical protein